MAVYKKSKRNRTRKINSKKRQTNKRKKTHSKKTKLGWKSKNGRWGIKYRLSRTGWSTSEKTPWSSKSESVKYPW